jgi:hypothetical protein
MAPANWKGLLRLSLVSCPGALYLATSDTEKVRFNQVNRKTGHRINSRRRNGRGSPLRKHHEGLQVEFTGDIRKAAWRRGLPACFCTR